MKEKNKYNKDVEPVVNLEGEVWRDVVGYEGMYKVSNKGRVASLRKGNFVLLHPHITKLGYCRAVLKTRPTCKMVFVHRLVAEAFILNPNALGFINHKDENGINNLVENLEWCDTRYNNTYGTALQRAQATRVKNGVSHIIIAYDLNGTPLARYDSARRAAKAVGCSSGAIDGCVRGRHLTSNGRIYLRETDSIEARLAEIDSRPIVCKRIARYRS